MAKDTLNRDSWQPVLLKGTGTLKQKISKLRLGRTQVNDQYLAQLEEWFLLSNPRFRFNPDYQADFAKFLRKHSGGKNLDNQGSWFYYPWLSQVVHVLPDKMYQDLRTGRNRYLITAKEQSKFYNSTIGILGMSVGSHVALTIVMTGGAARIKLADPDIISGSNLNRIRTGVNSVGLSKTIAVARQIYEINPYAVVEIFPEGLQEKNMSNFLSGLDLLVEEMDNPYFKLKVREMAKPKGIPIIMAADNGDGIIVDVERYDLNKKLPILHGITGKMTAEHLKHVEPEDLPGVMARIAGAHLSTERMLESVMEVGKSIYSWPQLGNAATMCGSVLTFLAREIINGAKIPSGRTNFTVEEAFLPPTKAQLKKRQQILKMMGIR